MDTGGRASEREQKKVARQWLGRTGERLAAERLVASGYHILERNFRCAHGEIDLVAEHEADLVFVEVKTRRGEGYGRPEEAVTARKQRKIMQVASYYLDLHNCAERSWRIDVVAVQMTRAGKLEEIRVYQHACTELL
ncbi:MAG: YraN family protein [Ktedonobacteraceae bacterium]